MYERTLDSPINVEAALEALRDDPLTMTGLLAKAALVELRHTRADRDRARDMAVALEQENGHLAAQVMNTAAGAPLADCEHLARVAAERERERDEAVAERDAFVQRLAALCDDDWLRRRDRCMDLPGSSDRRSRNAASAWEEAARHVRGVLNELVGYEDEYVDRHKSYLAWLNGGRDAGEAVFDTECTHRALEGGGES